MICRLANGAGRHCYHSCAGENIAGPIARTVTAVLPWRT